MSTTKPRQSRYRPNPDRIQNLQLQERDLAVIKQVHDDRFLTAQQIGLLLFPSYEMAKKRLQLLWNAGFLKREYAPVNFGSSPAIYCLTAKGRELLLTQGILKPEEMHWHKDRNRSEDEFKRHELAVNDIKVALTTATRNHIAVRLYHFGKGAAYYDRVANLKPAGHEKAYIPIRPDGFIILEQNNGYHYFFLEVDRGTMPLKRVRTKLKGYRSYYFDGGFFQKYGQEGYHKEAYSFRVLITCPTEETRNNRLEQACKLGSNAMCWFAVHQDVVNNPLGNIWVRGKEYKEAVQKLHPQTEYEWMKARDKTPRDTFIAQFVPKVSLIERSP